MAVATDARLMTADEFWEQYEGRRYELIKGVPVEMSPTGGLHQIVAANCIRLLGNFVVENRLGYVGSSEGGYALARNPDIIRGADASFISFAHLPNDIPGGYIEAPPDLAVEVVSPNDRAGEIMEKVDEYRNAGTPLVWVIYPQQRQVMVYRPGRVAELLSDDDHLDGGEVLPGFSISIRELWPVEQSQA